MYFKLAIYQWPFHVFTEVNKGNFIPEEVNMQELMKEKAPALAWPGEEQSSVTTMHMILELCWERRGEQN